MADRLLLAVAVLAMVPGCGILGTAGSGDGAVVQLERCKLQDGKVVAVDGGKGVVLAMDGQAETTVPMLKKGTYELVVYGVAPSYDEDAFLVSAGDKSYERLFVGDVNKLLGSQPLTFTQAKDGPCKITVFYAEDNVKLDRVEIKPAKE